MRFNILLFLFFPFIGDAQWKTSVSNIYNSNSGNIGIGTTTPPRKLSVTGDVLIDASGTSQLRFQNTGVFKGALLYNAANDNISIYSAGSGSLPRLSVTSSGSIGIGTSYPRGQLEVVGIGKFTTSENGSGMFIDASELSAGNNYSNIILKAGDLGSGAYLKTSITNWGGYFSWTRGSASGDVEVMRIDASTGNVGIGTSSPVAKLQVAGDIRQSGRTTYLLGANSNQNQAVIFGGWRGAHGGMFWRGDSRTFTLSTGDHADNAGQYGDANLSVTDNVSIGTTNPQGYKLAVNGNAIFNKIKVKQYPWADYVFDADYKLPSLQEVEEFIKQHKHLPDVPSAKEVEANGLDLGDNQARLLKKIEELTIYIIEQNKKIESLQTQNEQLIEFKKDLELVKAKLNN